MPARDALSRSCSRIHIDISHPWLTTGVRKPKTLRRGLRREPSRPEQPHIRKGKERQHCENQQELATDLCPGEQKPLLPHEKQEGVQVSCRCRRSAERRKSRRPANQSPPESAKSAHSIAVTGSRSPHTQRQIHAEMFGPPRQSRIAFLNSCWHKRRSWSHSPPVRCFSSTAKARASPICPSAQTARLRARSACFGDSTYAIKAKTRSPCSS